MATSAKVFDGSMERWLREQELPWQQLKYRLVQANLARHVRPGALRVLDAGGGHGADSIPLAAQGHRVDLVDYSGPMLAEARRRAEESGVSDLVAVHQADVQQIATLFPDPLFDLVLCHNVLQYVEDVPALLRSLAATLKPGGLLSILSINRYSLPYVTAFFRGDLDGALEQLGARMVRTVVFDTTMTTYAAEEIGALLAATGCAVEGDYGIRCLYDYWGDNERKSDPATFAQLERLELALTDQHPYKLLARYFQLVARKAAA